jgi:hypothetical protein
MGLFEHRHGIVGGDDHKCMKLVYFQTNLDDERQAEISRSNCLPEFQVPKASAARDLLVNFGQLEETGKWDGFKIWGTPNL